MNQYPNTGKEKLEKLSEVPNIETNFGGPALADEVYNDSEEIRIVINQLIDEINKLNQLYEDSLAKTTQSKKS